MFSNFSAIVSAKPRINIIIDRHLLVVLANYCIMIQLRLAPLLLRIITQHPFPSKSLFLRTNVLVVALFPVETISRLLAPPSSTLHPSVESFFIFVYYSLCILMMIVALSLPNYLLVV